MNVVSLFSGVGGFDLGLEAASMKTIYQCEWDKHARTILDRHWPDVPKWGDITTLTAQEILRHGQNPDVIAWGSPCQDLSVAGKRAGLEGERSGLFHEGMRIIKELRKETNNAYPRISIWENVAGALSSNRGADFGIILDEMAQAGAMVIEWAMLDAQHFGIPQRRRRVFVIAIFDPAIARNCPNPLLPVSESLRGNTQKGKQKRQAVTGTSTEGSGGDGEQIWIDRAAWNQGINARFPGEISDRPAVPPLVVGVPHAVLTSAEAFVKSRRAQSSDDDETWVEGKINPTLNSFDTGDTRSTTAIVFDDDRRVGPRIFDETVSTLQAFMGTGGNNTPMVAQQPVLFENSYRDGARIANDGVTQTLSAKMGTGGGNTPMLAFDTKFGSNADICYDQSPPLKASQGAPSVSEPTMAVRRLTPLECERLMGWPDDHTRWKADGTEQADTHRYKQCGNGVASPVAKWIAQHILNIPKDPAQ
jgi:DNA (cytosine-5)-methyltransferase 1